MQGKEAVIPKLPQIAWTPPEFDYLKLNVDGSWQGQNEAGGGRFEEVSLETGTWDSRASLML